MPPDRLPEVAAALPEHIRLSRAEPGCLSFCVTPDATHLGRFIVEETFDCQATFDAHQIRTKASDWSKITAGLPRAYEITEITP